MIAGRNRKLHRSSIHHALGHTDSQCGALRVLPEVVDASKAGTPPNPIIRGMIEPGKDAALALIADNLTEPPPHSFISFSDGSHNPEKGAGAAAVEYNPVDPPSSRTLKVRVGEAEDTSPFQAELTGFELAVANARERAPRSTLFFWFFTDNQTLINDLTGYLHAKPGMNTCIRIRQSLKKLLAMHPGSTAAIIWCPSKQDVVGLKLADAAAKAAVSLPQIIGTEPNPSAVLKRIKQKLLEAAAAIPPQPVMDRLMGVFEPEATYKALAKLSRADATAVAQVRSGHCPLNAYLFRFKASDTPNCDLCGQRDDVCHLLTTCRKFIGLRRALFNSARKLKTPANRAHLLTNPKIFKALADFIRKSHRFYKARHRRYIKTTEQPRPGRLTA